MVQCVSILGSTGSIGRQSLDIIRRLPGIRVAALTAGTNVERMAQQCREFSPKLAVMATQEAAQALAERIKGLPIRVNFGEAGLMEAASLEEADCVITAVVGMVGLKPTLAAIRDDEADLIVGTHAILSEGVEFARLGLAVVDEQHRFGVRQRGLLAEKAALYLYPRRCPFCGAVLGRDAVQGTVCPACFEAADKRLVHLPPRLPETEHAFYALNSAVAAYYYSGEVRHAILACKRGGELWRARELADRMAVLIWGAMPSHTPGRRPAALAPVGMPRYHYIVPVPPREPLPGTAGMPLLLARRLGILMQTPVLAPLYSTKPLQPQKELTRAERLANKKDAYACRPGTDLSGKRVLLVDDIITTGATVSACALALQQAGAYEITAAAVAATEELPKSLQKSTEKRK